MKPIDIILILLILTTISLVIYFGIWKKRKNPCLGCPYSRNENCSCNTKINSNANNSTNTTAKTQIDNNKIQNNNNSTNEDKNSSNKV